MDGWMQSVQYIVSYLTKRPTLSLFDPCCYCGFYVNMCFWEFQKIYLWSNFYIFRYSFHLSSFETNIFSDRPKNITTWRTGGAPNTIGRREWGQLENAEMKLHFKNKPAVERKENEIQEELRVVSEDQSAKRHTLNTRQYNNIWTLDQLQQPSSVSRWNGDKT